MELSGILTVQALCVPSFLYGYCAVDMPCHKYVVLGIALTCEALAPITFLVTLFFPGEARRARGTRPLRPKKRLGRATQALLALSSMRN